MRRPLALLVGAMAMAGCGADHVTRPGWVASHPNPAQLSFATTAPGLCALAVRYPDQAPAAISFDGGLFVQEGRGTPPPPGVGRPLARSGDWTVLAAPSGDLVLVTPAAGFTYRRRADC